MVEWDVLLISLAASFRILGIPMRNWLRYSLVNVALQKIVQYLHTDHAVVALQSFLIDESSICYMCAIDALSFTPDIKMLILRY